jgi:hypothetical protein
MIFNGWSEVPIPAGRSGDGGVGGRSATGRPLPRTDPATVAAMFRPWIDPVRLTG